MCIAQIYLLLRLTILSFPGLITHPKHWNINLLFFFQSLYLFFQFTVYLLLGVNMAAIIIHQSLSTYHSLDFCKNCWTLQKKGSTRGKLNAHSDKEMMLMRNTNHSMSYIHVCQLYNQFPQWHQNKPVKNRTFVRVYSICHSCVFAANIKNCKNHKKKFKISITRSWVQILFKPEFFSGFQISIS